VGHPIELDRVLGEEANFAGTSFLTLEKLNTLRYGSDIVNVVATHGWSMGRGLGVLRTMMKACRRNAPTLSKAVSSAAICRIARRRIWWTRAIVGNHANGKLESPADYSDDERQFAARNLEAGRSDCGYR